MNSERTDDVIEDPRDWLGFEAAIHQTIPELRKENMKNTEAFRLLSKQEFVEQLKKDYRNNEQIKIAFNETGRSKMKGPDSLKAGMIGKFPSKVAKQAAKEVIMAQVARHGKFEMLKKAIIDVQNKTQKMEKDQVRLELENKTLKEALQSVEMQAEYRSKVEDENATLKDKIHELEGEKRKTTFEMDTLRVQMEALQASEDANKELKDTQFDLKAENRQLKREIASLKSQIDELQACKGAVQNYMMRPSDV
ncbi:girdin-like [Ptychodera flava]|uniref:girdin-like n=1 Tax=Ptychodera flava TaxID=63121 RepID=UPI003969D987